MYEQQTPLMKYETFSLKMMFNENVLFADICCSFLFVWHSFLTLDVLEHSIETLRAYKMDIQLFKVFFQYVIFVFVVVFSGTCLISFILFFRFLWIVLFPFLFRPACHHPIYTLGRFYIIALLFSLILPYYYTGSSQPIQSYSFLCHTLWIYIYISINCCRLFSCLPSGVFSVVFSVPLHSLTQTFTRASNLVFAISNICDFVNLTVFIPVHTYICHKLPFL